MFHIKIALLYLKGVAMIPLLPFMFLQVFYIRRQAVELPDAKGNPFGGIECKDLNRPDQLQVGIETALSKQTMRFLHIGESTVSGVGVQNYQQGLSANIAKPFSEHQFNIQWHSLSKSGIQISALTDRVIEQLHLFDNIDFIVVTLGVNDAIVFNSNQHWLKELERLSTVLENKYGNRIPIFFSEVPALQDFPLLPQPLASFLGIKASMMNLVLQKFAQEKANAYAVFSGVKLTPEYMAEDGFHPNAKGYQAWGEIIADQIINTFNRKKKSA